MRELRQLGSGRRPAHEPSVVIDVVDGLDVHPVPETESQPPV
jgi:hypothetical protein